MNQPTENFSFKVFESLSNSKDFHQQKAYLKSYFIPLYDGQIAMFENGIYDIKETAVIKSTYFKRMPKPLTVWFFEEYTDLKLIVCELGKPVFYDDNLNVCPQIPYKYKPYSEFPDDVKNGVEMMNNYILEILASDNKDSYHYILKWFSKMMKGEKNESILYLRTKMEGIGKSTVINFIRKHILTDKLCLETGIEPLKSNFNSVLLGKLLVFFEEIDTKTTGEWSTVSDRLKRYTTSDIFTCEKKNCDSYNAKNINNYVIASNNNIKGIDGRRFFVADVSTKRKGDNVYWNNLHKTCFNNDVGYAFYCYLLEIDTSNFEAQRDMPITQNKKDALYARLDTVDIFLKEQYILKNKSIYNTVAGLFLEYQEHTTSTQLKKVNFVAKLKELEITHYPSSSQLKYKVSLEQLQSIAEKYHWIHELDETEEHNTVDRTTELLTENQRLQAEITELKRIIADSLEDPTANKKKVKKPSKNES